MQGLSCKGRYHYLRYVHSYLGFAVLYSDLPIHSGQCGKYFRQNWFLPGAGICTIRLWQLAGGSIAAFGTCRQGSCGKHNAGAVLRPKRSGIIGSNILGIHSPFGFQLYGFLPFVYALHFGVCYNQEGNRQPEVGFIKRSPSMRSGLCCSSGGLSDRLNFYRVIL